ncbi:hypothetical protein [Methanoplanus limicola]|uniref:CBM-cenC domain-containing protein n=1 Tax=Methanoplanus limicola DSM 2279 TaxID=937775 RepID=H1YZQ0_9EURY|nr:hypothetical protein [Methanoplanus limicola]EHQ34312.1 hypothetical protein Metlim_0159 [Methanoplanus limicola DSM 2279]
MKRGLIICISVILLGLIPNAIAFAECNNIILNGDFEEENFNGWITQDHPPYIRYDIERGHNAGFFFTDKCLIQETDLTDIDEITYDLKILALGPSEQSFNIYIGKTLVRTYVNETFQWRTEKIDTSEFSGNQAIIFTSEGLRGSTMNIYLDNIRACKNSCEEKSSMPVKSSSGISAILLISGIIIFAGKIRR